MNGALLKGKIREKSMTQGDVAEKIGISLSRFNAKLNNLAGTEFSLGEVRAIKALLHLDAAQVDQIFFDSKVSGKGEQTARNQEEMRREDTVKDEEVESVFEPDGCSGEH